MANISNEAMIRIWQDKYKCLSPDIINIIIDNNLAERKSILNMVNNSIESPKKKWYQRLFNI